jgi:hypothetical protein
MGLPYELADVASAAARARDCDLVLARSSAGVLQRWICAFSCQALWCFPVRVQQLVRGEWQHSAGGP